MGTDINTSNELSQTISQLTVKGKGILAADESTATIGKRFNGINLENTEENRRRYRDLLCTTPKLSNSVCGVILFEETLGQSDSKGIPFPEILSKQGILPGIKVDKGLIDLVNSKNEKTTQGLDGLLERLASYKKQGAKFSKWRVVYTINDHLPSHIAIMTNAESLARYAAICQSQGIVPIIEPELLINGDHNIERCAIATEMVLRQVFQALARHKVALEHIVLKPSMVIAGNDASNQASTQEVAQQTVKILRRVVPAAVPTINFLSGGQTPEQATEHLKLMNQMGPLPWNLSFSYGRALQEPSLATWKGKDENRTAAQSALLERCSLNSAASQGQNKGENVFENA